MERKKIVLWLFPLSMLIATAAYAGQREGGDQVGWNSDWEVEQADESGDDLQRQQQPSRSRALLVQKRANPMVPVQQAIEGENPWWYRKNIAMQRQPTCPSQPICPSHCSQPYLVDRQPNSAPHEPPKWLIEPVPSKTPWFTK
ncbi:hypothetical protein JYU14_04610 [Simkania negevensis]|uniref:Secreted protein n=1 Tax=Simkania negevensis TaxID=83561 RepID=A0ABS3ARJ1_9BACT|nr:hypothetical protein [Simkania negevensis]